MNLTKILVFTRPDNDRSTHLLHAIGLTFDSMIILPGTEKKLMLFTT